MMKGQTIGKAMAHGYAGSFSRQPDSIIDTHPLGGAEALLFGMPVAYGADGAVRPFGADGTAEAFLGVAVREVKSATNYFGQNAGAYQPKEAVPVMKRGCVNVLCQNGIPAAGGAVYVRTVASDAYPNAVVGGFEAAADPANSVELANARWKGAADANGIAEIRILSANNA